ncbi:hypothetical protein ACPV5Q_14110 [Vibrio astriarenae]
MAHLFTRQVRAIPELQIEYHPLLISALTSSRYRPQDNNEIANRSADDIAMLLARSPLWVTPGTGPQHFYTLELLPPYFSLRTHPSAHLHKIELLVVPSAKVPQGIVVANFYSPALLYNIDPSFCQSMISRFAADWGNIACPSRAEIARLAGIVPSALSSKKGRRHE